jgi:hypothetical protein
MENLFDQEASTDEIRNKIIESITEEPVVENLQPEDFTVVDESDIDWSKL